MMLTTSNSRVIKTFLILPLKNIVNMKGRKANTNGIRYFIVLEIFPNFATANTAQKKKMILSIKRILKMIFKAFIFSLLLSK